MSDMATMAMPVSIDGPLPLAPPYGLVPTVEIINDPDEYWINGAQVWGYPPGNPSAIGGCVNGTFAVKDIAEGAINPTFGAITTYLAFQCTKRSFRSYDELKARLLQAFDASDSHSVASEFANGIALPLNPYLGDPDLDIISPNGAGNAISAEDGLAFLEDAIGATGRQGIIHITPATLPALDTRVIKEGGKLRTMNGTLVVSDGGYIGAVPADAADPSLDTGESWMFATGPVQIRRSNPFIPQDQIEQALDRSDNTVVLYAERYYLVSWDGELQAGILVDWTTD